MSKSTRMGRKIIVVIVLVLILVKMKMKQVFSTEKKIFNILIQNGIPSGLSLLIVAQSKHETAAGGVPFSSRQCLMNNNYFGYGFVKGNNLQMSDGGKHLEDSGRYAKYTNLDNSVMDIVGYYQRRAGVFFKITDSVVFANALKSAGYYTDTAKNYAGGVKSWYKTVLV